MIPRGSTLTNAKIQEVQQPSRTYRIDLARKRIVGMTDRLEAVQQAVYKILRTVRFEHIIYSFNYGHELNKLIGKDPLFVRSEIRRMLREALLQDDRITGIGNLQTIVNSDSITVQFTVNSQYGSFDVEQEVS